MVDTKRSSTFNLNIFDFIFSITLFFSVIWSVIGRWCGNIGQCEKREAEVAVEKVVNSPQLLKPSGLLVMSNFIIYIPLNFFCYFLC